MTKKTDNKKIITIDDHDQRLTFSIRKMQPLQLEHWLLRVLHLMVRDTDATEADYMAAGKRLASGGLWQLLTIVAAPDDVLPLMDQLLTCCSRLVENVEQHCAPENIGDYVQDVTTLFTLKNEALKLNVEFLLHGGFAAEAQGGSHE